MYALYLAACTGAPQSADGDDDTALPDALVPSLGTPLVDPTAWTPVASEDDPLVDHRPDTITCPSTGLYSEGRGFEIDTGRCNYVALSQPTLAAVPAGGHVGIFLFHNQLTAVEPAEAHVAVLWDAEVVWEQTIPIPAYPAPYDPEVPVPEGLPAGTALQIHLHNHGANTWNVLAIEGFSPDAPAP